MNLTAFGTVLQQEGTLMGTAFATCFGYWFGVAGFVWIICYICNTRIGMIQILNILVSFAVINLIYYVITNSALMLQNKINH